jgi:hypothetical protein
VFSSEYASELHSTHEDMDIGDSAIEMVDQPKPSSKYKASSPIAPAGPVTGLTRGSRVFQLYGSLRARLRSRSPSASSQQRNVLKRRSRSAEMESSSQAAASHARNSSYGEVEDRLSRTDGDLRPRLSTIPSSRASGSIADRRESRPLTRSPTRPFSTTTTTDAISNRQSQITADPGALPLAGAQPGPSAERPRTPTQQPTAKPQKRRSFFGLLASPRRASFRSTSRPTSPISPRMSRHHDRDYTSAPSSRPSIDLTTAPPPTMPPPPSFSDPNIHAPDHDQTPRPNRRTKLAHTKLDFWFHPRFFSSNRSHAESSSSARRGPRFAMGGASFLMATAGAVQPSTPAPAETAPVDAPDSGTSEAAYTSPSDFDESPGIEAEEAYADADGYLEHSTSTHATSPSMNRKVTISPQRVRPLSPSAGPSADIPSINLVLPTPPRERYPVSRGARRQFTSAEAGASDDRAPSGRGVSDNQHYSSKMTRSPSGRGLMDSQHSPRSSQLPRERSGKDKERRLSPSRVGSPIMMSSTVSVNNPGERSAKRSSSHSRGAGGDRNASLVNLPATGGTRTILNIGGGGGGNRAAIVVPASPSGHGKHGSFDFERPGAPKVNFREHHARGANESRRHGVGGVPEVDLSRRPTDRSSSANPSRKNEDKSKASKNPPLSRSNSDRLSPKSRERATSPSNVDQGRVQSSSWGRSSSKSRGPLMLPAFSFEPAAPAVSGPMPLSSRKGPADVAASKKAKDASAATQDTQEGSSKRRLKGRSLDLPLGLAWAPSRMRESTIMPFGIGVGRRFKGTEVDQRVEEDGIGEIEDEVVSPLSSPLSSNAAHRHGHRSPVPPSQAGRSRAPGRSVDLPLSLSWAPNKVREEAMLPIGVGRTRWNATAPARTGIDEQGRRLR